jgi:hypothetical protein
MTNHGLFVAMTALLASACAEATTAPDTPAAVMLGEWRYARAAPAAEPPSLNAGLFVTIAIDSAAGSRFTGRVTAWFAGDVGISVDAFGPVTGSLDETDRVMLLIAARTGELPAHTVIGQIEDDVITVLECWVGPEANVGPFPVGGRFQRLH